MISIKKMGLTNSCFGVQSYLLLYWSLQFTYVRGKDTVYRLDVGLWLDIQGVDIK